MDFKTYGLFSLQITQGQRSVMATGSCVYISGLEPVRFRLMVLESPIRNTSRRSDVSRANDCHDARSIRLALEGLGIFAKSRCHFLVVASRCSRASRINLNALSKRSRMSRFCGLPHTSNSSLSLQPKGLRTMLNRRTLRCKACRYSTWKICIGR